MFYSEDGEALDLRGETPTWRNVRLENVGRSLRVQTLLLGLCAVVLVGAVPWAVATTVAARRGRRRGMAPGPQSGVVGPVVRSILVVAALLALSALVMLKQYPFLLFGRMPVPRAGLPVVQQVGLALPYVVAGLTAVALTATLVEWRRLAPGRSRAGALTILAGLVLFSAVLLT